MIRAEEDPAAGETSSPKPVQATRRQDITLPFGDGDYRFKLGIGEFERLQEKCDAGPPHVLERLTTNRWMISDIRETIRLGLEGGGTAPAIVVGLIRRYVDQRPPAENLTLAQAIILAGIMGVEDEPLKKARAPARKRRVSPATK